MMFDLDKKIWLSGSIYDLFANAMSPISFGLV